MASHLSAAESALLGDVEYCCDLPTLPTVLLASVGLSVRGFHNQMRDC